LNDVNVGIEYQLIRPNATLPVPMHLSDPLESYLRFCTSIGNRESTITWKRSICVKFLYFLSDLGCSDAQEINSSYICRAIIHHSNKDAYAIVREFLRYLHEIGTLKLDYSGIIPKYNRGKVLPTTYSIDEVRCLEASVDRSSKVGKRDYAVLLLATRLGLRSGDIVGLTFDKIDFIGNNINLTQEKTKHPLTLPLLPEIRAAIGEYVQYARPDSDSEFIFLSMSAPFGKMTTGSTRHMLNRYFLAAGINIKDKKHGLHSMRSSLASSMVNDGVPYEVLRRLLGHRDPNAVKHYAKIDIENLRNCAIDVPFPSGNFKALLEGRI
jgi:site-specific recombinase XerD